ncbi:hypothetical protein [Virgisporangium aurantiacum]|uniref:hypothetical protein n=1 Tax=Virgisporangium aurantiacum TaxID=175570 RepID=UPI0019500232|nr:hypothetical protein [Virgisporangium aurantiacum]
MKSSIRSARTVRLRPRHGDDVGFLPSGCSTYTLPWTRMRAVYRLLGLTRRYGDQAVNAALR